MLFAMACIGVELLAAWLEGKVPADDEEYDVVCAHLASCAGCRLTAIVVSELIWAGESGGGDETCEGLPDPT